MEIVKNLEFQQKFFNDIYKSYFDKDSLGSVGEEHLENPAPEFRDKILIYTDDFGGILRDVFHLVDSEKELQKYNAYNEIIIQDKRVENREVDQFHNSCLIELTHIYRLKHYTVWLVNKLNRRYINSVCEVILLKPLDLFSKRALKDIPYQDFIAGEEDDGKDNRKEIVALKDYLFNFRSYYDERKYIEKSLESKNRHIDDNIKDLLNDFDSVLGLEVVNQLLSSTNITSKSQYVKYKRKIVKEFQGYALSILGSLMEKRAFTRNFHFIEIYFEKEKSLQANLSVIFDEEIIPDIIKSFENEMGGVDLLIQSLQLYARRIDSVIKETVFQFKNEVLDNIGL